MSNHCGTCTACCRVYAIPEFAKPAGPWCKHCDVGKGCKIYDSRPERCVGFECLWLASQKQNVTAALPPELRPDKCKVVFAPSTNEQIMTAITMPGRPDAWRAKPVTWLIERLNRAGLSVAVGPTDADAQTVIKPDGREYRVRLSPPDKDGMRWSIQERHAHTQDLEGETRLQARIAADLAARKR